MSIFRLTERPWFYGLLFFAAALKFFLYFYIIHFIPEAFIDPDSDQYLTDAEAIYSFVLNPDNGLTHGMFALPGYPFFLSIWIHFFKFSLHQVMLVQLLFNFLAAIIISRIARAFNPKWELWAFFIVILDTPLTIYSQLFMTEAFYIVVLSCFILCFHRYLRRPSYKRLMAAGLLLLTCGFIRPVTLYLPLVVAGFMIFARTAGTWKKTLIHAGLIILIFYGSCVLWQYRNYKRFGDARFSSISEATIKKYGFFKDSNRKKEKVAPSLPYVLYYPLAFARNVVEVLTTPGSTKHCLNKNMLYFTKGFGYLFIVFWVPGFIVGLTSRKKDPQYTFLIWIFLYYLVATIGATGWMVTSRFRIAMLPSIAIITAAGWTQIQLWWSTRKQRVTAPLSKEQTPVTSSI